MTVERFISLNPELHDYLIEHSSFRDGSAAEVEQAARDMGELEEMQIGGDQAALITLLVRAIGARQRPGDRHLPRLRRDLDRPRAP